MLSSSRLACPRPHWSSGSSGFVYIVVWLARFRSSLWCFGSLAAFESSFGRSGAWKTTSSWSMSRFWTSRSSPIESSTASQGWYSTSRTFLFVRSVADSPETVSNQIKWVNFCKTIALITKYLEFEAVGFESVDVDENILSLLVRVGHWLESLTGSGMFDRLLVWRKIQFWFYKNFNTSLVLRFINRILKKKHLLNIHLLV